jgi:lysozyme family protein
VSDFAKAAKLILQAEGGYTDDPDDSGNWTGGAVGSGELKGTNFGVSARQYPDIDIANLTKSEAQAIYKRDYWDSIQADHFPWPLNLFMFDMSVNQAGGPEYVNRSQPAVMYAQKALGLKQDGIVGRNTKARAGQSRPFHWAKFMAYRAQRYQSTRRYDKYGVGWLTRIFTLAMET